MSFEDLDNAVEACKQAITARDQRTEEKNQADAALAEAQATAAQAATNLTESVAAAKAARDAAVQTLDALLT